MTAHSPLGLDADELASCVACGLCLPHCPTFRVTGEEGYSPRGRIDAMRGVEWRGAPIDDTFEEFMSTCVQCRGCEPACPSGVPFGHLMESTRDALDQVGRGVPGLVRTALGALGHHRALLAGSTVLAAAQRARAVPSRLGVPPLPLRRGAPLRATGGDVWIYTGCVMDAWMRDTHRATAALVTAAGSSYAVPDRDGSCCGALHRHAGMAADARRRAEATIRSMPGSAPILINSAGCGAAMKAYPRLLGTDAAECFSRRVVDIGEWLAEKIDLLPQPSGTQPRVIVQDPCHLRHVQRAQASTRAVLGHVCELVELDDEGLCCGAGGAYALLQPDLARSVRERKVAAIIRAAGESGAATVASANPGCIAHLSGDPALSRAGIDVRHPIDIVAEALGLVCS
jgi:glycolate oxidase iron-sulfur subunit